MTSRFSPAFLSLLLSLTPLGNTATAANTDLPSLGYSAGSLMTPKQESELGRAFMRKVRQNQAVLDDPLVMDYIQQLGERLVANSDAAGQHFTFFVIDNPQINAFAGPGGHIGIYTGLILTTETESELAAVLAHEIAHVSQRHLMRAWETAGNMAIPNAAILLASVIMVWGMIPLSAIVARNKHFGVLMLSILAVIATKLLVDGTGAHFSNGLLIFIICVLLLNDFAQAMIDKASAKRKQTAPAESH